MNKKLRSIALRYVLPVVAFAVPLFLAIGIKRWFGVSIDPSTIIIAVLIASAWYGGRSSGLLVMIAYEAAIDYFSLSANAQPFTWRYAIIAFNRLLLFTALVLFISSRRRAEKEREQLLQREQAARAEAESANRLKDEFLATVSHELRTPLNAILGWASLLSRRLPDEQTTRHAAMVIERNARSQAQIIEDILDVSRIITGKLHIDAWPVELTPIIQAAIDAVSPAAAAKAIVITRALDRDAGVVFGDPNRLQQIAWNLLSNALKFTPEGGKVEVRLERAGAHVELRVSDSGIGIDPQFLPYVFDRFRQADSSTTREHGGLGLGLAIVRHLVELHGGTVAARSDGQGRGAVFIVRLPLVEAREATARAAADSLAHTDHAAASAAASTTELRGLRVLVVDDDADTREVLCMVLSQHGAQVHAAGSSMEALGAFREWLPDVLMSDLGMPGEDGFALIEKVRGLAPEEGGDVPAVALTAYARDEDSRRARAAGYQVHIPKPVDPTRLVSAVAGLARAAAPQGKRQK
ncbi:MAG TPA: ATP-binding protein [Blastocatellia bacterium]|nr:ATP-binding protein [Blastocatellia bacterium]